MARFRVWVECKKVQVEYQVVEVEALTERDAKKVAVCSTNPDRWVEAYTSKEPAQVVEAERI